MSKHTWVTGTGQEILFDQICQELKLHSLKDGKVYVSYVKNWKN